MFTPVPGAVRVFWLRPTDVPPCPDTVIHGRGRSGATGTATRIIGWGQTCPTSGCGGLPAVANELDTSILPDNRCGGINGPGEICTDNPGGSAGACYGDSGGPQVRQIGGRWNAIGATSRGPGVCGTTPYVYGDLTYIRSWINSTVGGLPG